MKTQPDNPLHTLIMLSTGIRLPELEEEIFSDLSLAILYLDGLCAKHFPDIYAVKTAPDPEMYAYWYSFYILKDRWPVAEELIMSDSLVRTWYNTYIINLGYSYE